MTAVEKEAYGRRGCGVSLEASLYLVRLPVTHVSRYRRSDQLTNRTTQMSWLPLSGFQYSLKQCTRHGVLVTRIQTI